MRPDITALAIEDSPVMRHFLERALSTRYATELAADGESGLAAYRRLRPDIVVLDLRLPGMDGMQVIRRLRLNEGDQDVYLIVLTGDEASGIMEEALAAGANDFLRKPVALDELAARMLVAERHVDLNRRLRRALTALRLEMESLAGLQQSMLPDSAPWLPGMRFHGYFKPSRVASGDYYDFFPVGDGVVRAVIADIAGHGARAAFLMAVVRTLVRASRRTRQSLSALLRTLNDEIMHLGAPEEFVTLFAVDIDMRAGVLEYAGAGHCPGILVTPERVGLLHSCAPLLGVFESDFGSVRIGLPQRFGLFLFTDGMYEWTSAEGDIFGLERLVEMAAERIRIADDFMEAFVHEVSAATASGAFRDDLAALWVVRAGDA